jgi:hypothetical protein
LSGNKGYLRPFAKDLIVDYEKDFSEVRGLFGYLQYKARLVISTLFEIFLLLALISVVSYMFQDLLTELSKRSRNNFVVISISVFSKFFAFLTILIIEKATSN